MEFDLCLNHLTSYAYHLCINTISCKLHFIQTVNGVLCSLGFVQCIKLTIYFYA